MTEIPEEALREGAEILLADYASEYSTAHLTWKDFADQTRRVIGAALPHLRVQETRGDGLREELMAITYASDDGTEHDHIHPEGDGEAECPACWVQGIRSVLAAHPAPHPRPVVDREAVEQAIERAAISTDLAKYFQPGFIDQFADAVLALLPTEEGEGIVTTEDRVRTVREAYAATCRANQDGLPWMNPWAAVVAALDAYDEGTIDPGLLRVVSLLNTAEMSGVVYLPTAAVRAVIDGSWPT